MQNNANVNHNETDGPSIKPMNPRAATEQSHLPYQRGRSIGPDGNSLLSRAPRTSIISSNQTGTQPLSPPHEDTLVKPPLRPSQTASRRSQTTNLRRRGERFKRMFMPMDKTEGDENEQEEGKKVTAVATNDNLAVVPDANTTNPPADKRRKSEEEPYTMAQTNATDTLVMGEFPIAAAAQFSSTRTAVGPAGSPDPGLSSAQVSATTPASVMNASSSAAAVAPTPRVKGSAANAKLALIMEGAARAGLTVTVGGNRYIKLDVIGRGGSSKVYRVLGQNMEIYALKRVNLQTTDETSSTIMGYKNEIELLRKLRENKYVIQLMDAEIREEHKMIDIVLEFGETDLAKMLKQYQNGLGRDDENHINLNVVRMFWQQMLLAVKAIHEERIVHGDLKPANFVLVRGVLKLIDFGIAKQISQNTTHIVREDRLGTLSYMAPEAIGDLSMLADPSVSVKVSRAADTWSLGCILYQMVYGRPPFNKVANPYQKVKCICDPSIEIEFPARSDIPDSLILTLKHCLVRNPHDRHHIDDLLKDSFLTGEPFCSHCPHCLALKAEKQPSSSSSSTAATAVQSTKPSSSSSSSSSVQKWR